MSRILVIDDEPAIRDLLEIILSREMYEVRTAADGKSGLSLLKAFSPDLVILDLMLPDMSGHEVCREIGLHYKVPIIMLTAKNDIVDKVVGLELGADDYITKPFDSRELIARIKALLRRLGNSDTHQDVICHLDLQLNTANKTLLKNGLSIALTPREYELLELFVKNPSRVFSREELLSKAWGYDFMGDSRAVDIYVTRLRKKIEADPSNPKYIVTAYGFGYRLGN